MAASGGVVEVPMAAPANLVSFWTAAAKVIELRFAFLEIIFAFLEIIFYV